MVIPIETRKEQIVKSMLSMQQNRRGLIKLGAVLTAGLMIGGGSVRRVMGASAEQSELFATSEGAVFVGTNHNNTADAAEPANQVAMYRRATDGQLTLLDHFATGGQGSGPAQRFAGDGVGSGNSLRLSRDNRWLFVTKAGSNTLSVMDGMSDGLRLVAVAPTRR